MNINSLCAIAAALACLVVCPAPIRADNSKHDSNTLHKVGKAIAYPVKKAAGNVSKSANKGGQAVQYPVRKAGENVSLTTHRALGHNSVAHHRPQKTKAVVTPNGHQHPLPPN